jgi:hypothetical protein
MISVLKRPLLYTAGWGWGGGRGSAYTFGYRRTAEIFKTPSIPLFINFENRTHSYISDEDKFYNSRIDVINAGDRFTTYRYNGMPNYLPIDTTN